MGVKINNFGVEVPGAVVRKFDGVTTTLTIDSEQARVLHEATGEILDFLDRPGIEAQKEPETKKEGRK